MSDTLRIRTAVLEDAGRIAELSEVLGYPASTSALVERLRRLLSRSEEAVLVAELTSGIVGWVHGSEQELLEAGRRCEILGLVVDPKHRTRGIGRRLVAELEQWAASRGLNEVSVRSNVVRVESHRFYEHLGYVRAKTQHAYRKHITPS